MEIRAPRTEDMAELLALACEILGPERAIPFVRAYLSKHHVLTATREGKVVGFLCYRTDWFQCVFVTFVGVALRQRRSGVARALFAELESEVELPRLFASVDETNVAAIRMLAALGFSPSGHIDNLPQGYRELFFYKRREPSARTAPPPSPSSLN